jgi:transposase
MYARFEVEIERLNQQVLEQAGQRPTAGLLMTHPGVGTITALAIRNDSPTARLSVAR